MDTSMGRIDRRKHDIDVIERVLGSVRGEDAPLTEVVNLEQRPWLVGAATTAVQLMVGAEREDEKPAPSAGDDEYESDRRGEHKYPEGDRKEPPSHRERGRLRSRLERPR
jgi:hypothetical protein